MDRLHPEETDQFDNGDNPSVIGNSMIRNFVAGLNRYEDMEYLLYTVAYNAAPTIEGSKPSTLMSFTRNAKNLYLLWETYKTEICNSLGLEYYELKKTPESIVVMFYVSKSLGMCLNRKKCREFLKSNGYTEEMSIQECLSHLKSRFQEMCPHEIGLFLGIPVEDVVGFIENNGEGYLLCRYWKVYHDPVGASRTFQSYDTARESTVRRIMNAQLTA